METDRIHHTTNCAVQHQAKQVWRVSLCDTSRKQTLAYSAQALHLPRSKRANATRTWNAQTHAFFKTARTTILEQLDSRQPPPYTRTLKAVPSLKAWHQTKRPTQFTALKRRAATHHGTTNEQLEGHPPKSKSSSQILITKSPESPRIKHTFKFPFGHGDACPSAVERRVIQKHNSCKKVRDARTVSI